MQDNQGNWMNPDNMQNNAGLMAGLGTMGAGIGNMLAPYKNPAIGARGPLAQIPGAVHQQLSPWMDAGQSQLPQLQGQFGQLMQNPGQRLNEIGSNFQQSPGFKFALQQALMGPDHQAASGGMYGTPQHDQQRMTLATNLGNQDYYNWLNHATGLYGAGLEGSQHLSDTGFQGATSMSEQIAQALAAQSKLAYEGQNAQNQHQGGGWGSLLGGAGMVGGSILGGPVGGAIGGALGKFFGGQ